MENNIYDGPVADILKSYDDKKIGIEEAGQLLLHEVRNGGDVAYVESEVYQAILAAAGINDVVANQKIGDLLICRYFGTMLRPMVPRESGTFTSMNRVANWEDPKWLSGEFAWAETAQRTYIDGMGDPIHEEDIQNLSRKQREPLRFRDIRMTAYWEARASSRPVDVLIWKEWNEDYTKLIAIHHTTFVMGVPFHDHVEDNDTNDSESEG